MSAVFTTHSAQLMRLKVEPLQASAESLSQGLQVTPQRTTLQGFYLGGAAKLAATKPTATRAPWGWGVVLIAHALAGYWIMHQQHSLSEAKSVTPMMVSLIAPPAPMTEHAPELVPIVTPTKVQKKPISKPKKVIEKTVPIEQPSQAMLEASAEPVKHDEAAPDGPVAEALAAQATPQPAEVEEKLEPPKFGVSYLNNPPPDYPRMAKRIGEEGRVLLKVLVSAEGLAETVSIERSSGFNRLDQAARDAVSQWRFVPARKGGQSLSAYVLVPLKFSLSD